MGFMGNFKDFMGKVQKASDELEKQTREWAKNNNVEGKAKDFLKALQQAAQSSGNPSSPGAKPAASQEASGKKTAPRGKKTPFPPRGDFNPGENAFEIRYRNHAGEDKLFTGDKRTVAETRSHFSVRVAPTGKRIYLLKKSVSNEGELQALAGPTPHGKDKQVLSYHLRHGSTSAKFEEAKRKFASWL